MMLMLRCLNASLTGCVRTPSCAKTAATMDGAGLSVLETVVANTSGSAMRWLNRYTERRRRRTLLPATPSQADATLTHYPIRPFELIGQAKHEFCVEIVAIRAVACNERREASH